MSHLQVDDLIAAAEREQQQQQVVVEEEDDPLPVPPPVLDPNSPIKGGGGGVPQQQHHHAESSTTSIPPQLVLYPATTTTTPTTTVDPYPPQYMFAPPPQQQQPPMPPPDYTATTVYHPPPQPPPPPVAVSTTFLWGAKPNEGPSSSNTNNNTTPTMGWAGDGSEHQPPIMGGYSAMMMMMMPHNQQMLPLPPPPPRRPKRKKASSARALLSTLEAQNHTETALLLDSKDWSGLLKSYSQRTNGNSNNTAGQLVCPALLPDMSHDALYLSLYFFTYCTLTSDDRIGKYKQRDLGFVGMCCLFCGGQPGFGRYFPISYDSLLNGSNFNGMIEHLSTHCTKCPKDVRATIQRLQSQPPNPRPKYGARKRFATYVWTKLRTHELNNSNNNNNNTDSTTRRDETATQTDTKSTSTNNPDETNKEPTSPSDLKIKACLESSEMVQWSDRHLVPDATLVAMAQMKRCFLTQADRVGRCKDHALGFPGLACKHCGGKPGKPGFGRYFPSSLRSLSQADACQQMVRHVATKCTHVPESITFLLDELLQQQKGEGRIKYGSRMIFFKRVWGRLHNSQPPPAAIEEGGADDTLDTTTIPWDEILSNSQVVNPEDRGLIPDSQLVAIAQMKLCKLTANDRVGWFKDRQIGFGGLACSACGGRPSYGRYFPNSVRSFAQTTSSQTIVSHVAIYCQNISQEIRDIVLKLQKMENSNENNTETASYGSRKVFFKRVWNRMHGTDNEAAAVAKSPETHPHLMESTTVPTNAMVELMHEEHHAKRAKLHHAAEEV